MPRIKTNHPARDRIGELGDLFDSREQALCTIQDILGEYGLELELSNFEGDDGYTTFPIVPKSKATVCCDDCDRPIESFDNVLVFTWYRMSSGRWECVKYIS